MPGSTKVLVAEDDVDIANIYTVVLSNGGFVVEVARNGPETLDKTLSFAPDAILLDLMMPGLNGLQVLRTIRTDPAYAAVQPKIVVTTNLAQQDKAAAAKEHGAQGYVVKADISPYDLIPIIQELLAAENPNPDTTPFYRSE